MSNFKIYPTAESCPGRGQIPVKIFGVTIFRLNQPHELQIEDVGVHIPGVSDTFKLTLLCKHCGKWIKKHFVEHEALLEIGYTPDEIKGFRDKRN